MSILHITSGDCSGELISKTGIDGDVFVWHDILYTGPRNSGWPTEDTISARADFLHAETGGGLKRDFLLESLKNQYNKLKSAAGYNRVVLWFDACLFDMSMLVHILACLQFQGITDNIELLCVDSFPGIEPFDGLGQMTSAQLASVFTQSKMVTAQQFLFAIETDKALAQQDKATLIDISYYVDASLPWVPAAIARLLQEIPETGLGRLEQLALVAVKSGCMTPAEIYKHVSKNDTHPQFWGDTTLWGKINNLMNLQIVNIEGPTAKLPVWECENIGEYRVRLNLV